MNDKAPKNEGQAAAEKDITRMGIMVMVGLVSLLFIWPQIKDFISPVWQNSANIVHLQRDVAEIRKDINDILKHFPRTPAK